MGGCGDNAVWVSVMTVRGCGDNAVWVGVVTVRGWRIKAGVENERGCGE